MMVMIDTCQANTLYASIYSPNVLATGSSALGENSYSHHNDMDIGVAVIDSFTHHVLQYLERVERGSNATMREFVSCCLCLLFSLLTVYHSALRSSTSMTPKRSNPTPGYGRICSHTISPRHSLRISSVASRRWRCRLTRCRTIAFLGRLHHLNRQACQTTLQYNIMIPASPLRVTAKTFAQQSARRHKIGSWLLFSLGVCGCFSAGARDRVGGV
jgi:hypothetical protein